MMSINSMNQQNASLCNENGEGCSIRLNDNYSLLKPSYLFSDIARRVEVFRKENPDARIIRLGIGDVTLPLVPAVVEALHRAADEQADRKTFRGYGPEQGYDFLREAIAENIFTKRGCEIYPDEIFVSDGAKSDTGNFTDILARDLRVLVTDPVYPVYVDSNIMAGRADRLVLAPCTEENGFVPALPKEPVDLIYLCYPNNPTGTVLRRNELQKWVDYALSTGALILFDAAYQAFIRSTDVPRSIYEIPGARRCAVEFHSFSKTAGFTGLRCGYTVVPRDVEGLCVDGTCRPLRDLWLRRQTTKFNGTPYIVQRAAEAIFTEEGAQQVQETIDYYLGNAALMRKALTAAGYKVYGGEDSPYLWLRTPEGMDSWTFFEMMLRRYHIVCTPGEGFGATGRNFVRLTAFGSLEECEEGLARIQQ